VATTVYEALADPTRRRVIELLAERERSAGELARAFTVSRPAVSRHLRVLREAGLVAWRGDAQRRIYSLETQPFDDLDRWIESLRRFWLERLDQLEEHLDHARQKEEG
jgi:DNA-binding transcriptional ArsR family regulator